MIIGVVVIFILVLVGVYVFYTIVSDPQIITFIEECRNGTRVMSECQVQTATYNLLGGLGG